MERESARRRRSLRSRRGRKSLRHHPNSHCQAARHDHRNNELHAQPTCIGHGSRGDQGSRRRRGTHLGLLATGGAVKRSLVLFLLTALPALGADEPCDPEHADCTVIGALTFYRGTQAVDAVAKAVVNTNRPTTPPDAFAGRVHNSYQDFLNQLSFAINKVEESGTGQALTIRFNPIQSSSNLVGLTLTIAKPTLADAIKNAIPEASRQPAVTTLEQQLKDTDDRTWSLAYSYATQKCLATGGRCWGRDPSAYRDLLRLLLPPPSAEALQIADIAHQLATQFTDEGDVLHFKLSQAKNRQAVINAIKLIARTEAASASGAKARYEQLHLGLLASLIDNQPQITAAGNWHNPGPLGGPKERSATLELHAGRDNINTLRATCLPQQELLSSCLQAALDRLALSGLSTHSFVATVTYRQVRAYRVPTLPLAKPVGGFAPVDLPQGNQSSMRLQPRRQLSTTTTAKPVR